MHLPCKQVDAGALPADSTISLRGTRLKLRGRSHKPFEAGVIPAPAPNFWEVIRLPDCKSGVAKQSRKRRTGALPALPTIYGSVAQSAERPPDKRKTAERYRAGRPVLAVRKHPE